MLVYIYIYILFNAENVLNPKTKNKIRLRHRSVFVSIVCSSFRAHFLFISYVCDVCVHITQKECFVAFDVKFFSNDNIFANVYSFLYFHDQMRFETSHRVSRRVYFSSRCFVRVQDKWIT